MNSMLHEYDRIFGSRHDIFPISSDYHARLQSNKFRLGGNLFFGRLIYEFGAISSDSYPVQNKKALMSLYEAIRYSKLDELKKFCCYYYILLDWPEGRSEEYAKSVQMPTHHMCLMRSYYYLDRLDFSEALQNLMLLTMTPNFYEQVLAILSEWSECMQNQWINFVDTTEMTLETECLQEKYIEALKRMALRAASNHRVSQYENLALKEATEYVFFRYTHVGRSGSPGRELAKEISVQDSTMEDGSNSVRGMACSKTLESTLNSPFSKV